VISARGIPDSHSGADAPSRGFFASALESLPLLHDDGSPHETNADVAEHSNPFFRTNPTRTSFYWTFFIAGWKMLTSGGVHMALVVTRNAGTLLLAVWLILTGISGLVALGLPSVLMSVIALIAGALILVGR
jgi:hypothetical protein